MPLVNPLEHPDWDAPLTRRPDFSFFHTAAWTRVLAETYGFKPAWLAQDQSFLPLMEVDSWLTGRRAISLPFTDNCPALVATADDFRKLYQEAIELGRARGWKSIELRGGRQFLAEAPASLGFYGHHLNLSAGVEALFDNLDGSARQAVRKAEREGVTIAISQTEEATRAFYGLQCLTRQRHGLPPQPLAFFLNIWRHILAQNQGMIVLASLQGVTIAGAVYFFAGDQAIYKFGASDYRRQQSRPNNLVMWSAMKWLAQRGLARLHLGKTSVANEGLRKFKLNLGATEETLEYVKFDFKGNRFTVETDAIVGWHNRVFRRLPLMASRRAGELLYKHWA